MAEIHLAVPDLHAYLERSGEEDLYGSQTQTSGTFLAKRRYYRDKERNVESPLPATRRPMVYH